MARLHDISVYNCGETGGCRSFDPNRGNIERVCSACPLKTSCIIKKRPREMMDIIKRDKTSVHVLNCHGCYSQTSCSHKKP